MYTLRPTAQIDDGADAGLLRQESNVGMSELAIFKLMLRPEYSVRAFKQWGATDEPSGRE